METPYHPQTTVTVTNDARKYISLRDAAREIGATRRFLERRVECGEIAVFRPSRKLVRVSRDELNRWIKSYSHGGHLNPAKPAIPETEGSAAQ